MNRSKQIALGLLVLACFWILTGSVQSSHPVGEVVQNAESGNERVLVQARISRAQTIQETLSLAGYVEPYRTVTLKAETAGKVVGIPASRSQRVKTDETLVQLEMNDRKARLKQAEAELRQRKSDWLANVKLQQKGLRAKTNVLSHEALVAESEASLAQIKEDISNTQIKAPFAGVLDQRPLELGDFVDRGDRVAVLVDDSQVRISVQVSQHHLAAIKPGQRVTARLVTGEALTGTVSYIAHLADKETRSFRVEVQVSNPDQKPWLGLSARVELPIESHQAHLVSPALLNLDYQGELYVKALNSDNRVKVFPVSIIRHETSGFWVSGLPEAVSLITHGQGFYQEGDQIDASSIKRLIAVATGQEQEQAL